MSKNIKNERMDAHVIRRFKQRLHRKYDVSNIREIISIIQSGQAEPVYYISRTRKIYSLDYKGQKFGCVYNSERHRLHTVFPITWIQNGTLEEHILKTKEEIL